ncbi:MAG: ABC transporter substrate-binding protein [Pseudomonadota bacterium]
MQLALSALGLCSFSALADSMLKDGAGRNWVSDMTPSTVASSFLAGDEILIELVKDTKVKLVAISSVADDKEYSNIAALAQQIPHRIGANPESIAKIRPDVVFLASWNRPELQKTLSKLGIHTFTISDFNSIEDIQANIVLMGKVLHLEEKSRQMVEGMQRQMPQQKKKNTTFITFDASGVSLGKKTILDSLMMRLGLENVVTETGWPKLSAESIALRHPDYIVASGESKDQKSIELLIKKTPGWSILNALKTGNLLLIPSRLLSSASQFVSLAYAHLNQVLSGMGQNTDSNLKSPKSESLK